MSGGGGMGCRVPPADVGETEERDEDNIEHPSMKWSRARKQKSGVDKMDNIDVMNDKRLPADTRMKIGERTGMMSKNPTCGEKVDVEEGQGEA